MIWEERTHKEKMKEKIKGKGNLPGPAGMGAASTAEAGVEGMAGMSAKVMAGAGIPTPITTPGPSKVSESREIGI